MNIITIIIILRIFKSLIEITILISMLTSMISSTISISIRVSSISLINGTTFWMRTKTGENFSIAARNLTVQKPAVLKEQVAAAFMVISRTLKPKTAQIPSVSTLVLMKPSGLQSTRPSMLSMMPQNWFLYSQLTASKPNVSIPLPSSAMNAQAVLIAWRSHSRSRNIFRKCMAASLRLRLLSLKKFSKAF